MFNWTEIERFQLDKSVEALSTELKRREIKIATVESCTGGGVAALFTEFAGSSIWFDRGFVTYSNQSKIEMVGVSSTTLSRDGAVSEQVAREMALGGIAHSDARCALSITGVAGPDGGSETKPVGLVCFGWAGFAQSTPTQTKYFQGDRQAVRTQSVIFAVQTAVTLFDIGQSDGTSTTN